EVSHSSPYPQASARWGELSYTPFIARSLAGCKPLGSIRSTVVFMTHILLRHISPITIETPAFKSPETISVTRPLVIPAVTECGASILFADGCRSISDNRSPGSQDFMLDLRRQTTAKQRWALSQGVLLCIRIRSLVRPVISKARCEGRRGNAQPRRQTKNRKQVADSRAHLMLELRIQHRIQQVRLDMQGVTNMLKHRRAKNGTSPDARDGFDGEIEPVGIGRGLQKSQALRKRPDHSDQQRAFQPIVQHIGLAD